MPRACDEYEYGTMARATFSGRRTYACAVKNDKWFFRRQSASPEGRWTISAPRRARPRVTVRMTVRMTGGGRGFDLSGGLR
jgi:hypothetical protein